MTYLGRVLGGKIVIDGDAQPEEGRKVKVEMLEEALVDSPVDAPVGQVGNISAKPQETWVGQRLMRWAGKAEGLPADSSVNLDHYLYGLPKK